MITPHQHQHLYPSFKYTLLFVSLLHNLSVIVSAVLDWGKLYATAH